VNGIGFPQFGAGGQGAPPPSPPLTDTSSSAVNFLIAFFGSLMICSVISTLPLHSPGAFAWTNRSLDHDSAFE
jgi:hypothetical protein